LRYSIAMRSLQPYRQLRFLTPLFLILSQWTTPSHGQSANAVALYQQSLAATCANCHGTDGKGVPNGGMPLINHLSKEKILAELLAYKAGTKVGTIMPQLCKGYTDEQLTAIAQQLGAHE
jgi:cytochrome subunit of sulfide dehydrogenase